MNYTFLTVLMLYISVVIILIYGSNFSISRCPFEGWNFGSVGLSIFLLGFFAFMRVMRVISYSGSVSVQVLICSRGCIRLFI